MKLIKFSIIALVLTVSAQFAKAQVRVGASIHIGNDYPIYEPAYYPAPVYERPVYYARPAYRRVYYRPAYRRVYYRPAYRRGFYGPGYFRGHPGRGRGHAYGRRW
ncbi:hypothetical protein DYU05_15505 [Mucilaginibacter terrenus]|uniref:Virulence factor n=1 Tax=Mucilaginibacter terrenus TaxID=2482727 RepID=A0A3E2NM09_9SPHI|nr:hypothetical protein [Mucilaginibacter terrenus]RFZ82035.1 hypothetical protein DYU05_15505 [Mucilaginibacter terrenus]